MGSNRIAELSPRQLECLRLVARHQTSDAIAFALGISPKTVDYHVREAIAKLGATGRREAGQMMLEWDTPSTEKSTGEISRVDSDTPIYEPLPPEPEGSSTLRDVRTGGHWNAFESFSSHQGNPDIGRAQGNDLTILKRLALIAGIAVAIVVIVIGTLPMAESYRALANFIEPFHQN